MKIAIVNTHITDTVGGSQYQCDLIAQELVDRGHDVHYVAVKGRDPHVNKAINYQLHRVERLSEQIARACVAIEPDIVYWRFNKKCFRRAAKLIAMRGIPIVFAVSHLSDVQRWASKLTWTWRPKALLKQLKNRVVSRWNYGGFDYVSGVVSNNASHLRDLSFVTSKYIANSIPPNYGGDSGPVQWPSPYCLWIGSVKAQKRPELYVDLANSLVDSGVDFLMIGPIRSAEYAFLAESEGRLPSNFHYLGVKSPDEVASWLSGSAALVHTGLPEGFPNVFIQAWAHGKPVVTLSFDPDNVVTKYQLGYCSGSMAALVRDVSALLERKLEREKIAERARRFVAERFDLKANVTSLEKFLQDVLTRQKAAAKISKIL